jgi:RHS repeat-associated protein
MTDPQTLTRNSTTYYYHNDHLGTPQSLTDQNGQIVWQAERDAFGNSQENTQSITNNLGFAGQYLDRESGLYYNWQRYYDTGAGRYIETDPIGLDGGINTYAYVGGNPVGLTDPKGLDSNNPPICSGPNCVNPPYDPTSGGAKPSPQSPNAPKDIRKATKCPGLLEQLGFCKTCADLSKNYSGCSACCKTIQGALRSGLGSQCYIECSKKHKDYTNPLPVLGNLAPKQSTCSV